jgi:hypothetical protein
MTDQQRPASAADLPAWWADIAASRPSSAYGAGDGEGLLAAARDLREVLAAGSPAASAAPVRERAALDRIAAWTRDVRGLSRPGVARTLQLVHREALAALAGIPYQVEVYRADRHPAEETRP